VFAEIVGGYAILTIEEAGKVIYGLMVIVALPTYWTK
jgi:hypothetical protein